MSYGAIAEFYADQREKEIQQELPFALGLVAVEDQLELDYSL